MTTKKYVRIFAALLLLPFVGCANVFEGMANKTTDEALYEDVQNLMDEQNWDDAITKLESMSPDFQARTEVRESWAGVYAGKCGLNFLTYFKDLGDANVSGTPIFSFFMNAWRGKTVNPEFCAKAQAKLEEISAVPAERTSGQNLFLAILGMVKIGIYLHAYADTNDDGTAEVNICTNLAQANLDEIITGMGLITTNITYLTAVLSNDGIAGALDAVTTACAASPGACGKTDPADVTDTDRDLFRDILSTGPSNPTAPIGVGTCSDVGVITCC